MSQVNLTKYEGFLFWALITGLFLGLSITSGQDISEEGIMSMIIAEFHKVMPIPAYSLIQFMLFMVGMVSLGTEVYNVWKEGLGVRIMVGSAFLSGLSIFIGSTKGWIPLQNLGLFFLFAAIIILFISRAYD